MNWNRYGIYNPRPVKYGWVVVGKKHSLYMQWALDIDRHFLDVWHL